MRKKNTMPKKTCLCCNKELSIRNYYKSTSELYQDGYVPWCKSCIVENIVDHVGKIDLAKLKKVLQQLDKPYYKDVLQLAINQFKKENPNIEESLVEFYGAKILAIYFKNVQTYPKIATKNYNDSAKTNFLRDGEEVKIVYDDLKDAEQKQREEYQRQQRAMITEDLENFEVTSDIIELFGEDYDKLTYKKMWEKYNKLKINYTLTTNLHQEALATYVRFKVQEEIATAQGNVDEAKKWYDAAQNAADKAKLTPKQLTKADLNQGVNSMSELSKAVEQAVDVIKILPQFKYRANDSVDFCLYSYINYERRLSGLPEVGYEDIYAYYDDLKDEYIQQYGDPTGIFTNDTTISNREAVKKFIKLPKDYNESSGTKDKDDDSGDNDE